MINSHQPYRCTLFSVCNHHSNNSLISSLNPLSKYGHLCHHKGNMVKLRLQRSSYNSYLNLLYTKSSFFATKTKKCSNDSLTDKDNRSNQYKKAVMTNSTAESALVSSDRCLIPVFLIVWSCCNFIDADSSAISRLEQPDANTRVRERSYASLDGPWCLSDGNLRISLATV